jgi:uncharacterized damage-inducible protein DinB
MNLSRLYAHLQWADMQMLDALRKGPSVPDRVMLLFGHTLAAEEIWLARISSAPYAHINVFPTLSLDQCEAEITRIHAGYQELIADLKPHELERMVAYTNTRGQSFATSVGDILLHVALHGSYHRGQIAQLLRASGDAPPATDFIVYARE